MVLCVRGGKPTIEAVAVHQQPEVNLPRSSPQLISLEEKTPETTQRISQQAYAGVSVGDSIHRVPFEAGEAAIVLEMVAVVNLRGEVGRVRGYSRAPQVIWAFPGTQPTRIRTRPGHQLSGLVNGSSGFGVKFRG